MLPDYRQGVYSLVELQTDKMSVIVNITMTIIKKCKLDPYTLVKHFGGMTATSKLLTAYGHPISPKAVEKWRLRGRIPIDTIVMLAVIAKDKGIRFDLYDFIVESSRGE